MIFFEYNYVSYTFDDKNKCYTAIYLDLNNITNKSIHNEYGEGLNTLKEVEHAKVKYGDNEYPIKLSNVFAFFVYVEVPSFMLVMLSCVIWVAYGNNILALVEFVLTCVIVFIKVIYKRKMLFNNSKANDNGESAVNGGNSVFAIDKTNCWMELIEGCGYCLCCKCCRSQKVNKVNFISKNKNFHRVRRKYLLTKATTSAVNFNSQEKYASYVSINEIYPGDVMFLKKGDTLPCDAVILEGECIVRSSSLNGKTSLKRFTQLPNNQYLFSYKEHKSSILLQGMNIIQCLSKNDDKSIIVLCINTGANTYIANTYSNILYNYTTENTILFSNRVSQLLINAILFVISVAIYITFYFMKRRNDISFLIECILKSLATTLTPSYQLNLSLVYMYGNINLKNKNIQSVDDSRICLAGKVSTIFFDKTGTLSEEYLTVNGYHVLTKGNNAHHHHVNDSRFVVKSYKKTDLHLLSKRYLNYYSTHDKSNTTNCVHAHAHACYNEACFIEIITTCHSLEKIDNEIYGNSIDKEIFDKLKWDINSITISFPNTSHGELTHCLEVYPKNYYKMHQHFLYSNTHANSFKLQIIKRFFHKSSFHISAVVYNLFDSSLQFYIKGSPEEILPFCVEKTIPMYVRKLIDEYRKNGYRVIVCAFKELDVQMYSSDDSENSYKCELCFVGFITLRNNLKRDTKDVIDKLKLMHCELVMCTGDIVANALAVAYECKLISNRNVYVFDTDRDNKYITVCYLSKVGDKHKLPTTQSNHVYYNEGMSLSPLSVGVNNNNNNKHINNGVNGGGEGTNSNSNCNSNHNSHRNSNQSTVNINNNNVNNNNNINNSGQLSSVNSERKAMLDNQSSPFEAINNHTLLAKTLLHPSTLIDTTNNNNNANTHLSSYSYTIIPYNHSILPQIKHNSLYCISGNALDIILSNKSEYTKLIKYSQKLCKIYFHMSSLQKKCLIDFYKTIPNKTICMVGDSPNDLNAIMSSHIGIKVNLTPSLTSSTYLNYLCHFTTSSSISCVEKIIKNGRAAYENTLLLCTFALIATSLELLVMLTSYIINTHIPHYERTILEIVVFVLSALAFRMKADYNVDRNVLYQGKLFRTYFIVKNVVVLIVKIGFDVMFLLWYESNPKLSEAKGKEVLMTYLFLLILLQVISTLFAFNRETFFRKGYLRNKTLNVVMMLCVLFVGMCFTLTTRFTEESLVKVFVFEESEFEQDNYDDKNKLIVVIFIIAEVLVTVAVTEGVKRFFEHKAKALTM